MHIRTEEDLCISQSSHYGVVGLPKLCVLPAAWKTYRLEPSLLGASLPGADFPPLTTRRTSARSESRRKFDING